MGDSVRAPLQASGERWRLGECGERWRLGEVSWAAGVVGMFYIPPEGGDEGL